MKRYLTVSSLLLFSSLAVGGQPAHKKPAMRPVKTDVCSLLTGAEIQAVQGEKLLEAQLSPQPGKVVLSQCLFRTATPSKAISLAVALPGPQQPSGITPRQFWNKQFHQGRQNGNKHISETSSENQMEGERPRLIRGLGDEAYWVGNSYTGALYVLKGETFLRLSVGGIRDQAARIDKSKTLAAAVLNRL
jgi:hypothetical protein